MNKKILNLSTKKFTRLQKKYKGFINVIVDNWHCFRFIYDTEDVRKCRNECQKCPLFLLLKNEPKGVFTASLYKASKKDKKLFGSQNFLNCKTLRQYRNCYINFLTLEAKTEKQIEEELRLIKEMKIIFTREKSKLKLEDNFKKFIFQKIKKIDS